MARLLSGAPVAEAIREKSKEASYALQQQGISPRLAVLHLGDRGDTASYAASLAKNGAKSGVEVRSLVFPADSSQGEAARILEDLNRDPSVHGILLLRPLPKGWDEEALRNRICPEKDVDCATDLSLAGVFTGKRLGFAPATPRAVMELLHFYDIPLDGKRAVVLGRSLVVGRPLAMMMMAEGATVTLCHSRTRDLKTYTGAADLIVAAMGRPKALGAGDLGQDQIILDVGIHRLEDGSLCGDVDFAAAEAWARAITPVPGGIGAVTTAVLLHQVVEAAGRQN